MAIFVLIHGSNGGGWVWTKLAPLLRAAGHTVYAPTLSGMSDRSHLLDCEVTLTTHIADIANLLFYEDLSDVILVGSSYAGMVITGVAALAPERIKHVVYLDAYTPADGQCEFDLLPPDVRASRQAEGALHGGLLQAPDPTIFGVTDPALAAWVKARSTLQPITTYAEPVPAGNAKSAALPRSFIHCIGNPSMTPRLFDQFADKARAAGWPVYALAAGHLAMLTAPCELAKLLLQLDCARN